MTQPTRSFVVPTVVGRLHVQDSGPAGDAVALLWPSLFTDGPTSWGAQLTGLHDVGWRTLVIDPPGTGASPPPPGLFTMEECAEAALQTLDAADAQRAALLGLSWGGFVALRVALAAPKRVTGLVLSNTSARRMSFIRRQRDRLCRCSSISEFRADLGDSSCRAWSASSSAARIPGLPPTSPMASTISTPQDWPAPCALA
jgi:3-oxoadipate enol-lactonase